MLRSVLFAALSPSVALAQPVFYGLGDLPGGEFQSNALAISGDGRTVVGQSVSAQGTEAFYWTSGQGITGLGDVEGGDLRSQARAVNEDGSVIVGEANEADGPLAVRWVALGGRQIERLPLPDGVEGHSSAFGISADGKTTVGWLSHGLKVRPARWTDTGATELELPGKIEFGQASGATADGSTIVGYLNLDHVRTAYMWKDGHGSALPLHDGWKEAAADSISADGAVVTGDCSPKHTAVAWRAGQPEELPNLVQFERAAGVSEAGTVIVGTSGMVVHTFTGGKEQVVHQDSAVIWTQAEGIRKVEAVLVAAGVDLGGWKLRSATGVSADGSVICGTGTNPDGKTEAWVADLKGGTLPPKPPETKSGRRKQ